MKKLLLLITMFAFTLTASAQFKAGFGLGYAFPSGDIADIAGGGISGNLEVAYGINETIDIGILYQGDFLVGVSGDETNAEFENTTISSFLANFRYYLSENKFKPYASLGLGMAKVSQDAITGSGAGIGYEGGIDKSNLAIRPALGFKYGILNMNVAYLTAGKVGEGEAEASVGDISINLGLLFTFGG